MYVWLTVESLGEWVCAAAIACVHRGVQPVASRRIGRISSGAAAACRMIRMCGAWCGGPGDPVACASRVVLVVRSVRII